MKDITGKVRTLLQSGFCTPSISRLAKMLKTPAATIHYNVKKLEQEGVIREYKAVLDYQKAGWGFCTFVFISLSPDEYGSPEIIASQLAKHPQIESVDICTGDWEIIIKVRASSMQEYYDLVKRVISRKGILKIKSLSSMHQLKSEFVVL